MNGYDREYIRRTTPIYGGLRAARYGDPEDEGYVPLSPTHPLARRLRVLGSALAPRFEEPPRPSRGGYDREARRPYGAGYLDWDPTRSPAFGSRRWSRYGSGYGGAGRPSRWREAYDMGFRPLRPDEPLARALREETEDLVTGYLREERYGEEYARDVGLRTHGPADRLRGIARRLARGGYDRGW